MRTRRAARTSPLVSLRRKEWLLASVALNLIATRAGATPRMISYGYTSCVSCHVSAQGRGLLNSYGRGIDMAQSYSKKDFTAMLLGRATDDADPTNDWNGRFGPVLADFLVAFRFNQRLNVDKSDPAISALYRQVIFFGEHDSFKLNTELGFLDGGLHNTHLGPDLTATGGGTTFLKKLTLEWRIGSPDSTAGQEIAVGRDYLPLGLQIDDYASYILHLNRDGVYDFPLQAKYFRWDEKSMASFYVYGPSFQEKSNRQEYGGGLLYERYPTTKLALGVQGLVGFSDESDRMRIGPYLRWGLSEKWALLAQVDYGGFWDAQSTGGGVSQVTTYLQIFYHHTEWLVSNITVNYAYSDFLTAKENLASFRYTTAARLNRNFTLGVTFLVGDARRNLSYTQELGFFATMKF